MDIVSDNSHKPFNWTKDYMVEVLSNTKHVLKRKEYLEAFDAIDRADFVGIENKNMAYADAEISIGFGQKLSRPTVIAQQISLLQPKPGGRYLIIGAGSGYLAALVAHIVGKNGKVIALERILMLVEICLRNLSKYPDLRGTLEVIFKDGQFGYPQDGPYDGILLCAEYEDVPNTLREQVKLGGRVVIPMKGYEIRVIERVNLNSIQEKIYSGFVFDRIMSGVE